MHEEKGQISGTEIRLKGGEAGGKIKGWEIHHLIKVYRQLTEP